jgi:hypothetical protein
MKILYKQILNLELWHDYYLGQPDPPALPENDYDISEALTLVPTSDCEQVLKKLRWIFRPKPYGATIFAYVKEVTPDDPKTNFQTIIPIDRPERLTFWLMVRDFNFANFTNLPLPLTTERGQIYYFSNLSGNQGRALFLTKALPIYTPGTEYPVLFLTQPLPVYTPGTECLLGQLLTYQDKTVEALKYIPSADPVPSNEDWGFLPVGSQYVSALDQLPRQGLSYPYQIDSMIPGETVEFSLVDIHHQECFTAKITAPDGHRPGASLVGSLNFAGQRPGRYQIRRDGSPIDDMVLLDPLRANQVFALVEITLDQRQIPAALRFLETIDGQTFIQPQTYMLRFKNRATRWRYHYEKAHGFCLPGESPNGTPEEPTSRPRCVVIDERFDVTDEKTYVTKRPIGLLHRPKKLLNDKKKVLPAPTVTFVEPNVQPATNTLPRHISDIFSNVHL